MSDMNVADFDGMLKKYIEKNQQWRRLCLLLDYDGTLAPIASHPDLTVLPDETKQILERLSKMPDVFMGIITGRSIPDIKQKVGIPGITYAGNHGLDIVHPDGTKVKSFLSLAQHVLNNYIPHNFLHFSQPHTVHSANARRS